LPRVRIHSIDVQGGPELGAALRELGVRVVKNSPDLTVTLVNDYLERQLAELNLQRVSDKSRWLLVWPSGVFPLVGPVFSPGESACWTCLFDRMIRNREIKGFLDRGPARAVAMSPLARNPFGQSAIQFAAVEIAKAIASGFRTDLRDHLASFDLMGSTIAKALRSPTTAMSDLRQQKAEEPAPGTGADRAWPRREARDDQRRIPDGIVARDGGAFPKACQPAHRRGDAARSDRRRSANEHQFLRATQFLGARPERRPAQIGTDWRSFGGGTAEQVASALMETSNAIPAFSRRRDRIKALYRVPGRRRHRSRDILLFSDAQYQLGARHGRTTQPPPDPFDPSASIGGRPRGSLRDQRFKYGQPAVFLLQRSAAFMADSRLRAATRARKRRQGSSNWWNRDAYAIWWYNRTRQAEVDLSQFGGFLRSRSETQLADAGRKLWVLDSPASRHSHLCRDRAGYRAAGISAPAPAPFRSPHRCLGAYG
jgi:ribosomal protein S12 methylthiotransferase accessory factor